MIGNLMSKFSQWLSKKQDRAATSTEARNPNFRNRFDAPGQDVQGINRYWRRFGRSRARSRSRRAWREKYGPEGKLQRKAGAHKLAGRYSRLARRLEIIELRKKMGLDVSHLTCRFQTR